MEKMEHRTMKNRQFKRMKTHETWKKIDVYFC